MKIHRVWIGEYHVLRDITISFSADPIGDDGDWDGLTESGKDSYALDFLVGVNGTGKSTVLRAITEIFRRLNGDTFAADFRFAVSYEREVGQVYTVANVDSEGTLLTGKFSVRLPGSDSEVLRDDVSDIAPRRYVTYTTGAEEPWVRMGEYAEEIDASIWQAATSGDFWLREQPASGLPNADEATDGRNRAAGHVQIRAGDLRMVALCGLLDHMVRAADSGGEGQPILKKALRELGVERMTAFGLRFRIEPGAIPPAVEQEIADLRGIASRVRVQGSTLTLVFDTRSDTSALVPQLLVRTGTDSPLALFEKLASLSRPRGDYDPILDRVEMFLERVRDPATQSSAGLHQYDWLSDGEQTFLGRMCLVGLFGAADALILLDEPEVHFNDYWKRQLVQLIDSALAGYHSHAIVSTHSSIVLTDAGPRQIAILEREDFYTRRVNRPTIRTFASDPSDVLVHVFGAEESTGAKSVNEVRRRLALYDSALAGPNRERARLAKDALRRLHESIAPGYWRFRVRDALLRNDAVDASSS